MSTSIREALVRADVGWTRKQSTYPADFPHRDGWDAFFVTRHPVPRVLSYWKYRQRNDGEGMGFVDFVMSAHDMPLSLTKWLGGHIHTATRWDFTDVPHLFKHAFPSARLEKWNVSPKQQVEIPEHIELRIKQLFSDDMENYYGTPD